MSRQSHTIEPEELMAYLDGELSPERALETASHLEHCRECQQLSAELRQISQRLVAWEVEESAGVRIPTDFSGALMDRKNEKKEVELWRRFLDVRVWRTKAWALAAAATAVLVLFMAFGVSRLRPARMALPEGKDSGFMTPPPAPPRSGPAATDEYAGLPRSSELSAFSTAKRLRGNAVTDGKLEEQEAKEESNLVTNGPMIVRTVDLNVTVKEFAQARSSLDEILKRYQGHIGELNVNTPAGSARSFTAALRIPSPQLDSALAELKRLGRVEKEAQNGEEVTQQFVDLEARLKNARNTEARLIQLQRERTGKLSDVLSVEKEIGRVRGEIEQMEAERKSLRNRIDFATLNLTVIEDYKAELKVVPPSIGTQIRNAAVEGYRSVVDGLFSLLLWLLSWLPTLLIWTLVLFYPARIAWKKLRSKEA
jgi:uncharacterized protein DUF4349/putative zinc finger protein